MKEKKPGNPSSQSPSKDVLIKFMHITSCDLAIKKWDISWSFCPVCGAHEKKVIDPVHGDFTEMNHLSIEKRMKSALV